MKIEASLLKRFIKKASLNGRNMAINMDFTDTGIQSAIKGITGTSLTKTFLKQEAFEDYENIGEIFIKNTLMFLKYLDSFKGIIEMNKSEDTENILVLSDQNREGFIILGDEIVCENVYRDEFPAYQTVLTVNLTKADLVRALGDLSLLKTTHVVIEKITDKLSFEIGNKNESDYFKNIIDIEDSVGTARVKIADSIIDLYASLDSDFELKLGNDMPVICNEITEFIDYTCVIAPLTEGGD